MVEQWLGDDPLAAPLAAALRQREANTNATDDAFEGAATDPDAADLLERLYAEVENLRARSRRLADALGACPRCWGEDELCPICHGRGHPGGRPPDGELFAEVVEPAWRRRFGTDRNDPLQIPAGDVQQP
jgi:hypothetical protein